jgi:hypothetical protein
MSHELEISAGGGSEIECEVWIRNNGITKELKMKKMLGLIALIVAGLVAAPARATSLPPQRELDFLGGAGGSLSYTTGLSPTHSLSITDALILSVEAFPAFKTLPIANGTMDFMTAPCLTGCQATAVPGGFQSTPFFNFGGSLTIFGQLAGMSSPETLLSGTFANVAVPGSHPAQQPNASLHYRIGNPQASTGGFNGSLGITFVNPAVYNAFLPLMFQFPGNSANGYISEMYIHLSFLDTSPITHHITNGTWSGGVASSDILIKPVPEASGLLLFGSAMIAVAGLLRRKLSRV